MSIMDIFRSKPAVAPVSAAPNSQNGNPATPNANTQQSNGTGPAAIPAAAEGEKSPLEGYSKLWENDPTIKKPSEVVSFNADPAKIKEAAGRINFAQVIPEDIAKKALGGDLEAFAHAVNLATQATYAQSATATTSLIEQALAKQADMFKTTVIPEIVRNVSSRNASAAENPILSNPAVQPLVEMVRAQVLAKNPQASSDEIAVNVNELMKNFSTEIVKGYGFTVAPKPDEKVTAKSQKQEQDWGEYFDLATKVS
jgi:hypothetical protein